jgi:hypothetical protein
MRRLNLPIAVLAALLIPLCGLLSAAPAMAYNVSAVYKDCENNGQLTGHYSAAVLQAALNQLPAQVAEYSACADVIRQALLRASSHSGGHTSSSKGPLAGAAGTGGNKPGSGKPTSRHHPGKRGATSPGKRGRSATTPSTANAVTLANANIRPGSTGTGGTDSLPAPLLVVLILLALTAVSGGAVAIRRRVVARHGT